MRQQVNPITASYPILYSFRRCPYAMRARLALVVSNCVCELREVVLRDKPQEMLAVSPKGTVPVLIDLNGRVIDESIDIMLWALAQHDPEKWLMPEEGNLAAMLELISQCDRGFKYHLDRYKYPNRYEDTDGIVHRNEGYLYLERLNQQLSKTRYLFGNSVALADMAIAPFIRQFAHTDLDWFNEQQLPHLHDWLARFVDSEIYNRVMNKYLKWESGKVGVIFP
ncbi:glutathione S-transferase [Limnofasciculus baicalensis]|uniref:Glutathione S-transferase n=1 Tax=Limnofasciculus baicalensis BBK-W-15 TaxID=2699891 RepID=A0AAE3GSU7_9CYAN|nr:glutathione S-transferase [Limnofasciculus baicalensis]MCP2729327.1 glutathione S-transferase [Limnofasciculus baicalensis BBK-W-15]